MTFRTAFNSLDLDELTKYDIAKIMWNTALKSAIDLLKNNQYIQDTDTATDSKQLEFAFMEDAA